jgi:hypothetical protein
MSTDSVTGRQIEIEITPEMIEAGAKAIDPLDRGIWDRHEEAELIFRAMIGASKTCKASGKLSD